jgi:hypothetical protein
MTAARTIAGYETMAMFCKNQVVNAPANDMKAQSELIAGLFSAAA